MSNVPWGRHGRNMADRVDKSRIAVFASFSGQGGVERMIARLARGFIDAGFAVDMVLARTHGDHLAAIPEAVRVIELKARHTATSVPELARYLRRERPAALLAAKDRAIRAAVLARRLARSRCRLVGRLGTNLSASLEHRGGVNRWLRCFPMRRLYPAVDHIVAVSQGVAADTARVTGLAPERISVVRNPVITPELFELGNAPVTHPWLGAREYPVVLGAGRLTRQKDFATLIRAFSRVRAARRCRLIILGDGALRASLTRLADELGVAADVDLPGFQANPYAFMTRADLFVLSSAWEGSPNVLTEALALGTPAVSTACPSGPDEILAGGRYGRLVPVGDSEALAAAMLATLDAPPPPDLLKSAVAEYRQDISARGYLAALGLGMIS